MSTPIKETARALARHEPFRSGFAAVWRQLSRRQLATIPSALMNPERAIGTVAFVAPGAYGLSASGKVRPASFFPGFVYHLYRGGVRTRFCFRRHEIAALSGEGGDLVLVFVYNEDKEDLGYLRTMVPPPGSLVFNDPAMGAVIGDKVATNRHLSERGIPIPADAGARGVAQTRVFSNQRRSTGASVRLLSEGQALPPERYNATFVDTRRRFAGRSWFCMLRAVAVGGELVHALAGVRAESENDPSVHLSDTPLEPDLIEEIQAGLVDRRLDEIAALTRTIGEALGPGFYAHDLLPEAGTDRLLVCESGYKFEIDAYVDHVKPISAHVPSVSMLFTPEFADRSAAAFLRECRRHGKFLST